MVEGNKFLCVDVVINLAHTQIYCDIVREGKDVIPRKRKILLENKCQNKKQKQIYIYFNDEKSKESLLYIGSLIDSYYWAR